MKDPIQINFAELDRPYSKSEIRAYKPSGTSSSSSAIAIALFIIIAFGFVAVLLPIIGTAISAKSILPLLFVLPVSFFIGLISWAGYAIYLKSKEFSLKVTNLATANGLTYWKNTLNPISPTGSLFLPQTGAIFGFGSGPLFAHVIGNENFAIASYHYTTGSGKNRTTHYWNVATIKLSKTLPHTIFDSKSNNFLGMSNLPAQFKANQLLTSEAEFDKTFNVYAPEGYTIDVLSYIAPDFIAVMLDYFKGLEVEIIDDCVYIYQSGMLNANSLKQMVARMSVMQNELEDNIKHYRRTVVDASATAPTANGARLKRSFSFWPIVMILAVVAINTTSSIDLRITGLIIMGLVVVGAIVQARSNRK